MSGKPQARRWRLRGRGSQLQPERRGRGRSKPVTSQVQVDGHESRCPSTSPAGPSQSRLSLRFPSRWKSSRSLSESLSGLPSCHRGCRRTQTSETEHLNLTRKVSGAYFAYIPYTKYHKTAYFWHIFFSYFCKFACCKYFSYWPQVLCDAKVISRALLEM